MARKSTMRRVRKDKAHIRESGYLVTWDVDNADRVTAARLKRFVYGDVSCAHGQRYRYSGFVEKEGVRYLGRSVLFVGPETVSEIVGFLESNRIDHEVTRASVG